jgi:hypothetical protein
MLEKELIIPLADLNRAELVCQGEGCTGSLTVDFTLNDRPHAKCPSCEQPIAAGVYLIAAAWQEFARQAKNGKIQFRVKLPALARPTHFKQLTGTLGKEFGTVVLG